MKAIDREDFILSTKNLILKCEYVLVIL